MNNLTRLFRSSLGKKYVMAVTGLLLFGFVIGHMIGNLQIFAGAPGPINDYAAFLKSKPALLWAARIGLLALALLHIVTAAQLVMENRAARPASYEHGKPPVKTSFAARTIAISGLIIFAFIVYHLMHFTLGVTNPDFLTLKDPLDRHDVYRMIVLGFSNVWVSLFYVVATGLLCMHLSHGVSSLFQSLGLKNKTYAPLIDRFAKIAALVIFIGNASMPIAVLAGIVK
jgi:succinate dehydrogenase / fumarate reductase cytochrome b subunit